MQHLLLGALSILGIVYLAELNQSNPSVGLPVSAVITLLWLGTALTEYLGRRK